jgi:hypothetical protein
MLVKPCIIYQEKYSESGSSPLSLGNSRTGSMASCNATIQNQILTVQCPAVRTQIFPASRPYSLQTHTLKLASAKICVLLSLSLHQLLRLSLILLSTLLIQVSLSLSSSALGAFSQGGRVFWRRWYLFQESWTSFYFAVVALAALRVAVGDVLEKSF